jgi:hypothetical protein
MASTTCWRGAGITNLIEADAGEAAMLQRQNQQKNFIKLANSALTLAPVALKLAAARDPGRRFDRSRARSNRRTA